MNKISKKKGDHFGEYALFTDFPQQMTLRSLNYSTLLQIEREDFIYVCRERISEYVIIMIKK